MWEALIPAGMNLLGSMMAGDSNKAAANTSAEAQIRAAQIAADAAKFRPVGVTSAFGSSSFGTDGAGNVNRASYTASPEVAQLRDFLIGQAGAQGISTAQQAGAQGQGLFDLAKGYLAKTPDQAAADWMAKQQALLAPSRDVQMAKLQNQLANTGRSGLSIAQGGELGAANPEMQAYLNTKMMEDLALAAQAQEQGRAATTFGAGLFDQGIKTQQAGISPLSSYMGTAGTLEDLARQNLTTGMEIGGRTAQAGSTAANALLQGGIGAAKTVQGAASNPFAGALMGTANNPAFISGISEYFKKPPAPDWNTIGYAGADRGNWF